MEGDEWFTPAEETSMKLYLPSLVGKPYREPVIFLCRSEYRHPPLIEWFMN